MTDTTKSYVAKIEAHQDRVVLDGQYYSTNQIRDALKKSLETETMPGILTDFKTNAIVLNGFEKIGHVLFNPTTKEYCLSAGGAVSWLEQQEYLWLMHNRDHVRFEWPAPISEIKPTAKKELDDPNSYTIVNGVKYYDSDNIQ